MHIERLAPQMVEATATLPETLAQDARRAGQSDAQIAELLALLPPGLRSASSFYDNLTKLWRYEYGEPLRLEKEQKLLWGSQMWIPISYLRSALQCCATRVPPSKRPAYLARLDRLDKHSDVLPEMVPLLNVDPALNTDFEVVGRGSGERSIDWLVKGADGRDVLFDVKSRIIDLIIQMDKPSENGIVEAPRHAAELMFRSVEKKFSPADSSMQLQGAWLTTHIKQEAGELAAAFSALDLTRVHFVILAHWEPGGTILARNEADRNYLANLFGVTQSDAFVFNR